MGGAGGGPLSHLQHRDDLGHRSPGRDRGAARARRHAAAGAGALPERGSGPGPGGDGARHRHRPGDGRRRGRAHLVHREHALHRHRGGDAVAGAVAHRAGVRHRPSVIAALGAAAGARGQSGVAHGRDARRRSTRIARAPAAKRRGRSRAGAGWSGRAGAAGARRWPPALRLCLVVRDDHRRLAAGARDHLRPGEAARRRAAARAGRGGTAGSRQPGGGHPAPLDLRRRAGGQPVDDGGGGRDDRQLPRHRGLLDRPDAAGGPVHRPWRAAHCRVGTNVVGAGDRGRPRASRRRGGGLVQKC